MNVDTSIFKAYDIRGIYPESINEDIAYLVGQGYASYVNPGSEVLVGHDVRLHSEDLKMKVIEGLVDAGVSVVDVGLISTDMYYFGVGHFGFSGGIQVTASHNPPEWHGMKLVREKVIPLTLESGIGQIRDFVSAGMPVSGSKKGLVRSFNMEEDYCDYVLSWIKNIKIKPFKIVINANFGYAGKIFKRVVQTGGLPIELVELNCEPNGNFPKGRPDPFVPENRTEFSQLVKSSGADFGIAWDADADRVFFCANGGAFLEPYYLNTILIREMLKKFPGEKIIYDPRYSWALIEAIKVSGGEPIPVRVGHSYIKESMRKNNALYATESSGHTYYRDYWYADSGMIPVMQILEFLSTNEIKLSDAVKSVMEKYFISGEINSEVQDKESKLEEIEKRYSDAIISKLDGIGIEYPDWRFCVRPSNTEALLRLTLEAKSEKIMQQKRDEVLSLIRS